MPNNELKVPAVLALKAIVRIVEKHKKSDDIKIELDEDIMEKQKRAEVGYLFLSKMKKIKKEKIDKEEVKKKHREEKEKQNRVIAWEAFGFKLNVCGVFCEKGFL